MSFRKSQAYLPSKKILLPLIGGIFVIGIVFSVQQFFSGNENNKQQVVGLESEQIPDEDSDGLNSFEENLWGTDPNNPDSDGDGIPDGKEVKQNRDPMKASNDELTAFQREEIEGGVREGINTNKTKKLYGEILPSAIVLADQRSGTSSQLNEQQLQQIAQRTQQSLEINQADRPYTIEDVNSIESNKTTRQQYAQELFAALRSVAQNQPGDELELFADAARNRQPEQKYQQMRQIADNYTDLSQELLDTDVPNDLQDQHLTIINNFHLLALSVEEMTRLEADPARALAAIERYRKISRSNKKIFYQIGQRFNKDLNY